MILSELSRFKVQHQAWPVITVRLRLVIQKRTFWLWGLTRGLTLFTQASREVQRTITEERRGSAGQRDGPTHSAVETDPPRADRWRLGGWEYSDTPARRGFLCDKLRRGICGVCRWVMMPWRPTVNNGSKWKGEDQKWIQWNTLAWGKFTNL